MSEEKKEYKSKYSKSKSLITDELSAKVGFMRRDVDYPENMDAIEKADAEQLLVWHRFLKGARTRIQADMITRISQRLMGKK